VYRKLGGVPLIDVSNDKALLDVAGREIGAFLRELQAFPRDRAAALGVPSYTPESWRAFYRGFRAQCDARVGPLLNDDERAAVGRFWSSFLDDDANFRFTPALVHADLGPEHVLVVPDSGRLIGVIDFGDARVGDPAIDFTGLLRLQDTLLAGYGQPPDGTFPPASAHLLADRPVP
jgi:aminoglycoside 2''-phosphotransferase